MKRLELEKKEVEAQIFKYKLLLAQFLVASLAKGKIPEAGGEAKMPVYIRDYHGCCTNAFSSDLSALPPLQIPRSHPMGCLLHPHQRLRVFVASRLSRPRGVAKNCAAQCML